MITPTATSGQEVVRRPAINRIVHNAMVDLRYGSILSGTYLWNRDASCSDYALLDQIFAGRTTDQDVLVDVGSGGGRVINHWLRSGHTGQVYGLELNGALAAKSGRRLRKFANVRIIAGDAIVNLPDTGTLYYLFNPFDRDTMIRFASQLATSVLRNPRDLAVLYFNCKHIDVFDQDHRFSVSSVHEIAHSNGAGQSLATITARQTAESRI